MGQLRLVTGLGNPGPQYTGTRHNIGFMVIDFLAGKHGVTLSKSAAWNSELGKWGDILLVKPLSYMNRSGEAIGRFANYFKIHPEEVLVVVDDVALPLGRLRLRASGSDGGHNGLKSMILQLGETFMRLRVGIGASNGSEELVDHVLSEFNRSEIVEIEKAIERAAEAIEHVAGKGIVSAMNNYNRSNNIDTL
ncbi:MAG TPA: aminoacyl-tRNA hydrolase [Chthoniobacterales bacterium]